MSLFNIANAAEVAAPAAATASSTGSSLMSFAPMVVIFVLFWFLLIRPQQKKAKEHNLMLSQLTKGDKVLTNGGIYGRVVKLDDTTADIEIANNVVIQISRSAIANKIVTETVAK